MAIVFGVLMLKLDSIDLHKVHIPVGRYTVLPLLLFSFDMLRSEQHSHNFADKISKLMAF